MGGGELKKPSKLFPNPRIHATPNLYRRLRSNGPWRQSVHKVILTGTPIQNQIGGQVSATRIGRFPLYLHFFVPPMVRKITEPGNTTILVTLCNQSRYVKTHTPHLLTLSRINYFFNTSFLLRTTLFPMPINLHVSSHDIASLADSRCEIFFWGIFTMSCLPLSILLKDYGQECGHRTGARCIFWVQGGGTLALGLLVHVRVKIYDTVRLMVRGIGMVGPKFGSTGLFGFVGGC